MRATIPVVRRAPSLRKLTAQMRRMEERLAQMEAAARQSVPQAISEPAGSPTIGERAMKYAGLFRSGRPDLAENVEEEFYEGLWQRYQEGHV